MAERVIENENLAEKVCMVTGATSGIGKETAAALATLGASVVIVGRNEQKTHRVVDELRLETGNSSLDALVADFSDLRQVVDLAHAFQSKYSRLDVLINNAGAFFSTRNETSYGVESTFLINHLSPFLLTNLLVDTLKKSAPARIVNVSSAAHRFDRMDFSDLSFTRSYAGLRAYARSKLANLLFTYELSRRLKGSGVTVNALHPGHVATEIWRTNFPVFGSILKQCMKLIALTPEQGADTPVYLATSPKVAGVSGAYFIKRNPAHSSQISYDRQVAARLWKISEELTAVDKAPSAI